MLEELFGQTKLGMRVDQKFWCYINDVYMTVHNYVYNCLLSILNCATMFMSQIKVKILYQNYNCICEFTVIMQTV